MSCRRLLKVVGCRYQCPLVRLPAPQWREHLPSPHLHQQAYTKQVYCLQIHLESAADIQPRRYPYHAHSSFHLLVPRCSVIPGYRRHLNLCYCCIRRSVYPWHPCKLPLAPPNCSGDAPESGDAHTPSSSAQLVTPSYSVFFQVFLVRGASSIREYSLGLL